MESSPRGQEFGSLSHHREESCPSSGILPLDYLANRKFTLVLIHGNLGCVKDTSIIASIQILYPSFHWAVFLYEYLVVFLHLTNITKFQIPSPNVWLAFPHSSLSLDIQTFLIKNSHFYFLKNFGLEFFPGLKKYFLYITDLISFFSPSYLPQNQFLNIFCFPAAL